MSDRERLSEEEIQARLAVVPEWRVVERKLFREFLFRDFVEAFAFMTKAAFVSEKLDHHPDWSNVYNRVTVSLWTHDAGGLTDLDFLWAERVKSLKP